MTTMLKKKLEVDMPIWLLVLVLVGLFVAGVGVGGASSTKTTAGSTTVQTVQVPGETKTVTKVETKTVEVPTVPQSCLTAIDRARYNFTIASQGFSAAADGIRAAAAGNVSALVKANSTLTNLVDQVDTAGFNTNAVACEAAAK